VTDLVEQKKDTLLEGSLEKPRAFKETKLGKNIPGVVMVFLIAYISHSVGKDIPLVGTTVTAIIIGILIRNFIGVPVVFNPGIQYSLKSILKIAIILLGTSLNLWSIFVIGSKSILPILAVVLLGILLTFYIGKWMGLSGNIPILIGIGTAICGATAIATVSPIIESKEEETAFAITTIFIFNIIAVIFYPILGTLLEMNNEVFGMWAGTAIHDTSSVVAAGYAYNNEAGGIAAVVKLTRTLFLLPLAIILGVYMSMQMTKGKSQGKKVKLTKIFPWFLLGFLGMSLLNTFNLFSDSVVDMVTFISKFMILMAMASVGLGADFKKIRKIGMKPVFLGLIASVIVAVVSISLIYIVV
jgi:uncharacterized integral membrane protein (TIGR00698 family)